MDIFIDNRQELELEESAYELIEKVIEESLKVEKEDLNVEVSISFVSNEEIKDLNREYRNKDSVTDVLSFPMDFEDEFIFEGAPKILGDIIISLERAKEQAEELGHSLEREVAYLTAHSMFHLMGYDHMTDEDKLEMRSREKEVMKNLGIFKEN